MRTLALIAVIAGCGDNLVAPGYDSSFDDVELRLFGNAQLFTAPGIGSNIVGGEVCIDELCGTTKEDGTFVAVGERGGAEAVFSVRTGQEVPTIVGVVAGAIGDRNLGLVPVLAEPAITSVADGFGSDPALADHGMILMLSQRFDTGVIEVAIDGIATSYLDEALGPDPSRTSLSPGGGAVFFAVPPGEAVLRSVTGVCTANLDGWPGAALGEIRVPVQANAITFVRPFCRS